MEKISHLHSTTVGGGVPLITSPIIHIFRSIRREKPISRWEDWRSEVIIYFNLIGGWFGWVYFSLVEWIWRCSQVTGGWVSAWNRWSRIDHFWLTCEQMTLFEIGFLFLTERLWLFLHLLVKSLSEYMNILFINLYIPSSPSYLGPSAMSLSYFPNKL